MARHVDGVSFVGALGRVKRETACSWYHELNKKAWSSAFDTRDIQIDPKVAVGTPELSVEAALPETLPVLVDCREGDESSDCDLDSCPQLARTQLDIWRERPNFFNRYPAC